MRTSASALVLVALALLADRGVAQVRRLEQQPSLNNLVHSPGTATTPVGSLGGVRRVGDGRRTMVLVPGLGFGGSIWNEFMEQHRTEYTMFAVTLPGFGGTAPLPMPPDGSRYADLAWTRSAVQAILALLDRERIERATIVAHWALATQVALRLAIDRPDRVEAVVLIGGVLKNYSDRFPAMMAWTAEQRAAAAEAMASNWFRTVTRETWDDNNFMSYDYAVNPRRGLFLWREAQAPALPVWIRYLLEFNSVDLSTELGRLRVPTLVVQPGFDDPGFYVEPGYNYMRSFCIDSWNGAPALSDRLEFVTISNSRLFVMYDQPEDLTRVVDRFLSDRRRLSHYRKDGAGI